jgi:hypothetical protein
MSFSFSLASINVAINGAVVLICPVPGYTEFQNLFDEYMIDHVDLIVTSSYNFAAGNQPPLATLIGVPDYDDIADTTYSALQQYTHAKQWRFGETFRCTFSPRVQVPVYQTGALFAYSGSENKMWIDTSASNGASAYHYGYKMSVDNYNIGGASIYNGDLDIQIVMHFKMRDVR